MQPRWHQQGQANKRAAATCVRACVHDAVILSLAEDLRLADKVVWVAKHGAALCGFTCEPRAVVSASVSTNISCTKNHIDSSTVKMTKRHERDKPHAQH